MESYVSSFAIYFKKYYQEVKEPTLVLFFVFSHLISKNTQTQTKQYTY